MEDFSSLLVSEFCSSLGRLGTVCVQGVLDVCELLCNKGCYFVTICLFSGLSENPTRVGCGFLTQLGSRFSM